MGPYGSRSESNAWRDAGRRAIEVGRRADELQSELLKNCESLTSNQLAKVAKIIRKRKKALSQRATHVRPVVKTGGFETIFPHGIRIPSSRSGIGGDPAADKREKLGARPDAGARRATKKVAELDRALNQIVLELRKPNRITTTKASHVPVPIAAYGELVEVEKSYLEQSKDPRPIVIDRSSFRIIFRSIPYDPLRPEYTGPLRSLGGRPATDFWTEEQIRESREQQATWHLRQGLSTGGDLKKDSPRHPTTTRLEEPDVPVVDSNAKNASKSEPETPRSPGQRKSAEEVPVKNLDDGLGTGDERLEMMEDEPTPCRSCQGQGRRFANRSRPDEACTDCGGTGLIYYPESWSSPS